MLTHIISWERKSPLKVFLIYLWKRAGSLMQSRSSCYRAHTWNRLKPVWLPKHLQVSKLKEKKAINVSSHLTQEIIPVGQSPHITDKLEIYKCIYMLWATAASNSFAISDWVLQLMISPAESGLSWWTVVLRNGPYCQEFKYTVKSIDDFQAYSFFPRRLIDISMSNIRPRVLCF